ncbi:MAG TPA: hypothetical protein VF691_21415 [Cytophagaceae bacterium]
MKEYYKEYTYKRDNRLSFIIDCNGNVAYAYLLKDEDIVSDVWLYNVEETPEVINWEDKHSMPFLNPKNYTRNDKKISDIKDLDEVSLEWECLQNEVTVTAYFNNSLKVILKLGTSPGWSNNVFKDGPLAKVLI